MPQALDWDSWCRFCLGVLRGAVNNSIACSIWSRPAYPLVCRSVHTGTWHALNTRAASSENSDDTLLYKSVASFFTCLLMSSRNVTLNTRDCKLGKNYLQMVFRKKCIDACISKGGDSLGKLLFTGNGEQK
jgi:hypothetical protein